MSRFGKCIYDYRLGNEGQSVSNSGLKKYYKDAVMLSESLAEVANVFSKENKGSKRTGIVMSRMNRLISRAYTGLLLQDDVKADDLKEFDDRLRKYDSVYENSNAVKRIRLMRKTGFHFTGLYRKMIGV